MSLFKLVPSIYQDDRLTNRIILMAMIFMQLSLIALSIIFATERVLFADASGHFLNIVTTNEFCISHNRYIIVLSQFITLIGRRMELPLETLVILHSLNNSLFYFGIFIVLIAYRKHGHALALTIFQLTFSKFSFYLAVAELGYGIALLILLDAVKFKFLSNRYINIIIVVLIVSMIGKAHALLILPIVFLTGYNSLIRIERRTLFFYCILIASFLGFYFIFPNKYDSELYALFGDRISSLLLTTKLIIHLLSTDYLASLLLILLSLGAILMLRRVWLALWSVVIIVINLLLLATFGISPNFLALFELYLFPISLITGMLVLTVYQSAQSRVRTIVLTACIILLGVQLIALQKNHNIHTCRIITLNAIIDEMWSLQAKKTLCLLEDNIANVQYELFMSFDGIVGQAMILSQIKYGESLIYSPVFSDEVDLENINLYHADRVIQTIYEGEVMSFPNSDYPTNYFTIPDGEYSILCPNVSSCNDN